MGKRDIMGDFEYAVMRAINAESPKAYGVPIRQTVEEMLGKGVAVGAIYTTLDRLEEKGFVRSEEGDVEHVPGGRRKIVYFLEGDGIQAMQRKALSAVSTVPILGLPAVEGGRAK